MRVIDARIPTSYASAAAILDGKERRRIAANTEIIRTSATAIGVALHGTVVVRFVESGEITLHSGGYRTATTKARINSALRATMFRLAQRRGSWFVYATGTNGGFQTPFHDGMTVKA